MLKNIFTLSWLGGRQEKVEEEKDVVLSSHTFDVRNAGYPDSKPMTISFVSKNGIFCAEVRIAGKETIQSPAIHPSDVQRYQAFLVDLQEMYLEAFAIRSGETPSESDRLKAAEQRVIQTAGIVDRWNRLLARKQNDPTLTAILKEAREAAKSANDEFSALRTQVTLRPGFESQFAGNVIRLTSFLPGSFSHGTDVADQELQRSIKPNLDQMLAQYKQLKAKKK